MEFEREQPLIGLEEKKTVKTVARILLLRITGLKPGVNERCNLPVISVQTFEAKLYEVDLPTTRLGICISDFRLPAPRVQFCCGSGLVNKTRRHRPFLPGY